MASAGPSGMRLGLCCRYCPSLPALRCPNSCSQMLVPVCMSPLSFHSKSRQAAVFISRTAAAAVHDQKHCLWGGLKLGACQACPADARAHVCSLERSPSSQTYMMYPPPSLCTIPPPRMLWWWSQTLRLVLVRDEPQSPEALNPDLASCMRHCRCCYLVSWRLRTYTHGAPRTHGDGARAPKCWGSRRHRGMRHWHADSCCLQLSWR